MRSIAVSIYSSTPLKLIVRPVLTARTGQNVELKRIVRVNAQAVAGELLYITLEASDDCFYESKVYITNPKHPTDPDVIEVYFCRPAVHDQE
ncbi:hypothetical protein PanWU01x14_329050 [Parasponia andersonii]|uniref:Uncharacterized protein n=1 Tax=Parasponia andersonii TaxID=3476 RepID=A0A2P5AIG5_PARAD|nr:hypothetical protein PanWU01x14_329050 [Parasponia andersonii]